MPAKPKPVQGSIQTTKSGKFRAMIWVGSARLGKTFATHQAAVDWLNQTAEQKDAGLTYNTAKLTLAEWLDDWYLIKKNGLKINTQASYESAIRLHIKPTMGKLKLIDITPAILQRKYDDLVVNGLTQRPLQISHTIVHQALRRAARLGIIRTNPAELIDLPKPPSTHDPDEDELHVWEEHEVTAFLISVAEQRNRNLYHLAIATGMRRGELLGLQWDCIDWIASTVTVRQQVVEPPGGGWKFQTPKTRAGRRTITVGPGVLAALRDQVKVVNLLRQVAKTSKTGRWDENDLVFPSTVGTPQNGYNLTKEFTRLRTSAGLPEITFHDLRHTAASLMLSHGVPIVDVSHILGHSQVSTTLNIYGHYLRSRGLEIAALMDRLTTPIRIDLAVPNHPPRT